MIFFFKIFTLNESKDMIHFTCAVISLSYLSVMNIFEENELFQKSNTVCFKEGLATFVYVHIN